MNLFKFGKFTPNFKMNENIEQRKEYSEILKHKYPDRVPVIITRGSEILRDIDKSGQAKYLMPKNLKMSDLIYIIRKKIVLEEKQALFVFTNNVLVPMNTTIEEIYNEHHSEDNFLYMFYRTENTFG